MQRENGKKFARLSRGKCIKEDEWEKKRRKFWNETSELRRILDWHEKEERFSTKSLCQINMDARKCSIPSLNLEKITNYTSDKTTSMVTRLQFNRTKMPLIWSWFWLLILKHMFMCHIIYLPLLFPFYGDYSFRFFFLRGMRFRQIYINIIKFCVNRQQKKWK